SPSRFERRKLLSRVLGPRTAAAGACKKRLPAISSLFRTQALEQDRCERVPLASRHQRNVVPQKALCRLRGLVLLAFGRQELLGQRGLFHETPRLLSVALS